MSLSVSFHTNFVQMSLKGHSAWAPRAAWEEPAEKLLKDSAWTGPIVFSLTDLELEISRSLTPALTLVFPDGLEDWLSLQARSTSDQRQGLSALLATSQCLTKSQWKPAGSERALIFSRASGGDLANPTESESEIILHDEDDEILTWTSAIAQVFLKEKLARETFRFCQKHKDHSFFTATSEGVRQGLHSPLLGTPQALSEFLTEHRPGADNHLYLGWENFMFSYRDSLGGWHSHALPLQPFHSFKIDLHLKIQPEPQGQLFLPMCLSPGPRPTLLDVFVQFKSLPLDLPPLSQQRLKDGFMTFFNLKWTSVTLKFLLDSILEELFWSVESGRTSEKCLVEGPLADLFLDNSASYPTKSFELGDVKLLEAQFAEVRA